MRPQSRWPLHVFLLLAATAAQGQAHTVPLWGRWEQAFTAKNVDPETAPDSVLVADLTAPSGKTVHAEGFWDGTTSWRIRFMPTEEGRWSYRMHSVPAIEGLDGASGTFISARSATGTPFLQHGPLRISANGRFFEHADGTPFLWIGDTVWYGAILSHKADWDYYLGERSAKRFTVVHFNAVAPRNGVAADENGEVSFSGGERYPGNSRYRRYLAATLKYLGLDAVKPLRMNPRFYQRLDERVDAVNAHGLLAAIVLTWGLRPEDSGNALSEANVVRLVQYLQDRYGANHVVWILTGDNAYAGESGERWRRIGRAAFTDRTHAPVTTHPSGMYWPWQSFKDEKWLDFIVYQSGHGDDAAALSWIHSGAPSLHWQDPPPRPIINLEPPYEGHLGYQSGKPHTDYATRRAIYWSLLNAPTAGVTYGAHGVWSWHTAIGQPPTDHPDSGIAKPWREALSLPGSTQMKYLAEFFGSIPWWQLTPDERLLVRQPYGDDPARHASASRSESGELAVVYLAAGGTIKLRRELLAAKVHGEWFDPRTGRRTGIQEPRGFEFAAPDQQDWVLLLSSRCDYLASCTSARARH
ncbi:MAG TPA: DUF4038 domain-containing protein [Steroidobacteraceae bacterium]|nr:DUF4038 domain-containing protein [Steroidobacteraceae bacterium]